MLGLVNHSGYHPIMAAFTYTGDLNGCCYAF